MRTSMIGSIFLIMVLSVTGQALADSMIAPDLPHYIFNEAPFSNPIRYQQVYASFIFTALGYKHFRIESLAFSPMESGTYSANIDIRLGYTSNEPGTLSTDLDSNVLGPLHSVFSDPTFSENITAGSETFSLAFDFSSPFLYTPDKGNLLLDILISDPSMVVACSRGDYLLGSDISTRAYNSPIWGNIADDEALRTLIEFTPVSKVPEPSTMLLLGSGLLGLAGYGRKKLFKK